MSGDSPICTTCGETGEVVERTWWTYTARCPNPDCDNMGTSTQYHVRFHILLSTLAAGVVAASGFGGSIVLGVWAGANLMSMMFANDIRRAVTNDSDGSTAPVHEEDVDPVEAARDAYLRGEIDEDDLERRLAAHYGDDRDREPERVVE